MIGQNGIIVSEYGNPIDSSEAAGSIPPNEEMKQVYLVHLQLNKLIVTVYTSKDFIDADVEDNEPES